MLKRMKASDWLQVVPYDCTGMCLGGERCLSGETASETFGSDLPRVHMSFAEEMRQRKARLV